MLGDGDRAVVCKSRVWGKVPEQSTFMLGDTIISLKGQNAGSGGKHDIVCRNGSICAAVLTQHRHVTDTHTHRPTQAHC